MPTAVIHSEPLADLPVARQARVALELGAELEARYRALAAAHPDTVPPVSPHPVLPVLQYVAHRAHTFGDLSGLLWAHGAVQSLGVQGRDIEERLDRVGHEMGVKDSRGYAERRRVRDLLWVATDALLGAAAGAAGALALQSSPEEVTNALERAADFTVYVATLGSDAPLRVEWGTEKVRQCSALDRRLVARFRNPDPPVVLTRTGLMTLSLWPDPTGPALAAVWARHVTSPGRPPLGHRYAGGMSSVARAERNVYSPEVRHLINGFRHQVAVARSAAAVWRAVDTVAPFYPGVWSDVAFRARRLDAPLVSAIVADGGRTARALEENRAWTEALVAQYWAAQRSILFVGGFGHAVRERPWHATLLRGMETGAIAPDAELYGHWSARLLTAEADHPLLESSWADRMIGWALATTDREQERRLADLLSVLAGMRAIERQPYDGRGRPSDETVAPVTPMDDGLRLRWLEPLLRAGGVRLQARANDMLRTYAVGGLGGSSAKAMVAARLLEVVLRLTPSGDAELVRIAAPLLRSWREEYPAFTLVVGALTAWSADAARDVAERWSLQFKGRDLVERYKRLQGLPVTPWLQGQLQAGLVSDSTEVREAALVALAA